ncbi:MULTISPECIES: M15 family metallopeptidase [Actinomadura]|uniref:M15 family metallopeptidase n=1 Tax=Actinomadura TaxID=1988 RepID=UPI0027DEF4FB|nr:MULTISPECIES: M15 family metallopeptidase [Actinomadura]
MLVALATILSAAIAVFAVVRSLGSSESSDPSGTAGVSVEISQSTRRLTPDEANGVIPENAPFSVFDRRPAVSRLDPDLRAALRRAAQAAQAAGVRIRVNSGWRSPAYQRRLLRNAVTKYGSEREAARWVATAETSAHVSGDAVDLGPYAATNWLSEHGAAYGLCQIYRNEPWHYELRPGAAGGGCPSMFPDPTFDPRMRR